MEPKRMTLYKVRKVVREIRLCELRTYETNTWWIVEHGWFRTPQEAKDAYITERERKITKIQARIEAARNL